MFSFQSRCNNSNHFEAWDPGAETNPEAKPHPSGLTTTSTQNTKSRRTGTVRKLRMNKWNTAEHLDNSVKKHNRSTRQRAAQESEQAERWKVSRAQVKLIKAGNSSRTRTNTGSVKSK